MAGSERSETSSLLSFLLVWRYHCLSTYDVLGTV